MKIKFLGTAAAEGYPAPFCSCDRCKKAFQLGGKNLRTRSQAIINNDLLIDLPCDTYSHFLQNNIDTAKIKNLIITHIHEDHLYPHELFHLRKGFSVPAKDFHLKVFGSTDAAEKLQALADGSCGFFSMNTVTPFEPFKAGHYTVTALKANHGTANPYIYIITQGDKSVLYAHDTDIFPEETLNYLTKNKVKFNLVTLDCTYGNREYFNHPGHMYLNKDIECRSLLEKNGLADQNTKFVLNHFTHHGEDSIYDDFVKIATPKGFIVSFDGLEIEI